MVQAGVPGPVADPLGRAVRAVTADPVLWVVVAVVALALVLLALLVVARRLSVDPGDRLRRALADVDAVTVLLHPNPDPDAMAAAMGVARIAELVDTEAVLQYPGQIRHQENRAFRTVLDLDLSRVEDAADLVHEHVVIVDQNRPRGFVGADRVEPYAVIDHHPGTGTGTAFTDVRSDAGASASIVASYFKDLGARPGRDDPETGTLPGRVATGLLYGILADTAHLTKGATPAEFEAAGFLYPGVDEAQLDRIANPPVDQEVLEVIARAIQRREVRAPYALADVGPISNLDAIPQAADELLTLEGVDVVVVMGEKDGVLHLSGRSRDDRVHVGNVLRSVVDDIPLADGGGHARMGGGQINLQEMREGYGPGGGRTREELHETLFDALAGDV